MSGAEQRRRLLRAGQSPPQTSERLRGVPEDESGPGAVQSCLCREEVDTARPPERSVDHEPITEPVGAGERSTHMVVDLAVVHHLDPHPIPVLHDGAVSCDLDVWELVHGSG